MDSYASNSILNDSSLEMKVITFEDLPQVTSTLVEEVKEMKQLLQTLLSEQQAAAKAASQSRTMCVDEAATYLRMPKATLYDKLARGTVPALKTGKRYLLYQCNLDKWLETRRKNPVPVSDKGKMLGVINNNQPC